MLFLDLFVTIIVVLIFYFGMDLGIYSIWIAGGVGILVFLVTHWLTSRISDKISNDMMGMGSGGFHKTVASKIGKLVKSVLILIFLVGVGVVIYIYITNKINAPSGSLSLMNGQFPLPKDIKIENQKFIIDGNLSNYPVAANDKEVQQILNQAQNLPKISDQHLWADYYYSIGMKYYVIAKEKRQDWDPVACYAFARNNFMISSQLESQGTVHIESQTALLDCLHELRTPNN